MRIVLVISLLLLPEMIFSQIVQYGVDWKYFDLAMAPPNQSGNTWKQSTYNDASWATGPSELGYGDADEATVVSSATETAYFRFSFTVQDPEDYSDLALNLTYSDGDVVYLHGSEI